MAIPSRLAWSNLLSPISSYHEKLCSLTTDYKTPNLKDSACSGIHKANKKNTGTPKNTVCREGYDSNVEPFLNGTSVPNSKVAVGKCGA